MQTGSVRELLNVWLRKRNWSSSSTTDSNGSGAAQVLAGLSVRLMRPVCVSPPVMSPSGVVKITAAPASAGAAIIANRSAARRDRWILTRVWFVFGPAGPFL